MKKLLFAVPLIIFSCKKEAAVTESVSSDSAKVTDQVVAKPPVDSAQIKDSIVNNAPATKQVLREGVMRDTEKNKIIRKADASQLPFTLGEEFTEDGQELVLKLENFSGNTISATVTPENPEMNIRINQIRDAKGNFDGPFGREVSHPSGGNGEVWIVMGRSNMASGTSKGNFKIAVK